MARLASARIAVAQTICQLDAFVIPLRELASGALAFIGLVSVASVLFASTATVAILACTHPHSRTESVRTWQASPLSPFPFPLGLPLPSRALLVLVVHDHSIPTVAVQSTGRANVSSTAERVKGNETKQIIINGSRSSQSLLECAPSQTLLAQLVARSTSQ